MSPLPRLRGSRSVNRKWPVSLSTAPLHCAAPHMAMTWGMNDRSHCHPTEELAGYMHHPRPIPAQPGITAHIQGAKIGFFWSRRFSEPTWRRSEL